jgi:hypothetical protein
MGRIAVFTPLSFAFGEMTAGHWIGAAKMRILPQPEIELQSSSTSIAERTISEKYVCTYPKSEGCSQPFKYEEI